jgi:hypothetical protein
MLQGYADVAGVLSGVGVQKEYECNWVKTKMLAIELDYDGLVHCYFIKNKFFILI